MQISTAPDSQIPPQSVPSFSLGHQPHTTAAATTETAIPAQQIQQMASLVLKHMVNKYWTDEQRIKEEQKAVIRTQLPRGLHLAQVANAIAACIGEIAAHDFPERWPDLMDRLLHMFQSAQPDSGEALSAMSCLALISETLTDRQMFVVFPTLAPYSLQLGNSDKVPPRIRALGLKVFYDLIRLLGMIYTQYKKESLQLLKPVLTDALKVTLGTIAFDNSGAEDPYINALKMNAIKILMKMIEFFGKQLVPQITIVLQTVWKTVSQEYQLYVPIQF